MNNIEDIRARANQGDAESMHQLASCYMSGNGVEKNPGMREGMLQYMIGIILADKKIEKDEIELLTHYGSKLGFSNIEIANQIAVAIQQQFMPSIDSIS